MITGALAASYYGKGRTTADIDLVVRVKKNELPSLLNSLTKAGLEVNTGKVNTSIKAGYRILTLKDKKSPNRIDVILSRNKLARKPGSILGLPTHYQPPEDLILAKLRMIKATMNPEKSFKDRADIKAIITVTKVDLDKVKKKARSETTIDLLLTILG